MTTVTLLEAKTNLSKLVEAVESGRDASLVCWTANSPMSLEDFSADDKEIAAIVSTPASSPGS